MAKKKQLFTDMTGIAGPVTIRLPDGTKQYFDNSQEAQTFYNTYRQTNPKAKLQFYEPPEGEVNGGVLKEVVVTAPKKPTPVESDPIRDAIFEGRYNGRKFTPTPQNISHFLDLYESDKRIGENYGAKAWGKVLGTHALAAGGIYAGITAPAWLPVAGKWISTTGGPAFAKYVAAPTAAGMSWDLAQEAVTGTTTTKQVSDWLQKRGMNQEGAELVGGLTNPGYWVNFGGVGKYTRPIFNKIGLGLPNSSGNIELSSAAQQGIDKLMPKSLTRKSLDYLDRNLYKFQRAFSPYLMFTEKPIHVAGKDFPKIEFAKTQAELDAYLDTDKAARVLLFGNNHNNEKMFGQALRLKAPDINTKFYYDPNSKIRLGKLLTGAASGADIVLTDNEDRNPYVRALEYYLAGGLGMDVLARQRIHQNLARGTKYMTNFREAENSINRFVSNFGSSHGFAPSQRTPAGYARMYRSPYGSVYFPKGTHKTNPHPGFNYEKASFDDLVKFVQAESKRGTKIGDYSVDKDTLYDQTGRVLARRGEDGKIKVIDSVGLKNILARDINIYDFTNGNLFKGNISVDDTGNVTIPEDYTRILQGNIDYIQNQVFPGAGVKVFGSSAGVTKAGFPHATHDIDFYITRRQMDNLINSGKHNFRQINQGTYTYQLDPQRFGEQGNIDLNVIEQTPEGMATGIRAEELYKQYFPDEYFQALRDFRSAKNRGEDVSSIKIGRTPEQLLDVMDSSSKTIMDSFDIDFMAPNKTKHALRAWAHLVYSDPAEVSKGLQQYAKSMLGSRATLFPASLKELGNKETNLEVLQKLGVQLEDAELTRIASDPQRMKNVLDAWYMMDNTAMRYIQDTWPGIEGHQSENFIRSATTWIPEDNGGSGFGAGLNTTIGGDSGYTGPYKLKAFISPNLPEDIATKYPNLLDRVTRINEIFGRHPDAPTMLRQASTGKPVEQVSNLAKIYEDTGWSFLQGGSPYGQGQYASATRNFDPNVDYVGFSPTSTYLRPMIPRITINRSNHPLKTYEFKQARSIPAPIDFNLSKTSYGESLAKRYRPSNFPASPFRKVGISPGAQIEPTPYFAISAMFPGLAVIGRGAMDYNDYKKRNWLENVTSGEDEIVNSMPEKDRRLFTPEGVDSIQHSHMWLQEDSPDYPERAAYYELRTIYDKYKNKGDQQ